MATVGLPEMKRYGYNDEIASGSVAAGGTLGMLMPPSVVLIVYGVLTQQSIGQLFIAGIIPAIFITICFVAAVVIYCRLHPDQGPPGEKATWGQRLRSLGDMGESLIVFVLVMGGLFLGWFTPTEAGGVGACGILLVTLFRRRLTWKGFVKSLYETLRTSTMTLMLVAGAVILGHFLAVTRIPFAVAAWVAGLPFPPFAIMLMIVLVYLIGGCFIDAMALIMLTIPIFYPIVHGYGLRSDLVRGHHRAGHPDGSHHAAGGAERLCRGRRGPGYPVGAHFQGRAALPGGPDCGYGHSDPAAGYRDLAAPAHVRIAGPPGPAIRQEAEHGSCQPGFP
jgi:tripartite ATP-independent transporter DctM subunit